MAITTTRIWKARLTGFAAWIGLLAPPGAWATDQASFGVGITVDASAPEVVAVPVLPVPVGASPVAGDGSKRFLVGRLDPGEAAAFYRVTLPSLGYRLTAESGDAGAWSSRWRSGNASCLSLEVRPVVGGDRMVRIVERGTSCR